MTLSFLRASGFCPRPEFECRSILTEHISEFEYSATVRYDETRIGFRGVEESSPPAIREKASLMVSVVFVAAM
jgi:hypothetical protein